MKGIRVDIDTIRDAEALPALLELLKRYEVKATFFIATGCDRAGRNLLKYLSKPGELMEKMPLKRYGLKNLLLSLLHPRQIQEHPNLKMILEEGHELGLHGYEHYAWINELEKLSICEVRERIEAGRRLFRKAFKSRPVSFASPGFKTSNNFLLALEEFKFKYSSDFLCGDFLCGDFLGKEPFYPVVDGKQLNTLQIPVTENFNSSFYMHAHEIFLKAELLEQVLKKHGPEFRTFSEIAESQHFETLRPLSSNMVRVSRAETP